MSDPRNTPVRELLEQALPDRPPPTRLRREDLVAAGRRARTRRHALVSGCAVAAVAVATVGVLGLGRFLPGDSGTAPRPNSGAAARGASTEPSPTSSDGRASPSPTSGGPFPSRAPNVTGPIDRTAGRLSRVLQIQLDNYLPGATVRVQTGAGELSNVPAFTFIPHQGHGYQAGATVKTHTSVGNVDIGVEPNADAAGTCMRMGVSAPQGREDCTSRLVSGTRVYIDTVRFPSGTSQYRVSALRPDGTAVWVFSSDYDRAGDDAPGDLGRSPVADTGPVLGLEQTIAVVLNPDLRI